MSVPLYRKTDLGIKKKYFELVDIKSAKTRDWVESPAGERIVEEPIIEVPVIKAVKSKKPKKVKKNDNKD